MLIQGRGCGSGFGAGVESVALGDPEDEGVV